MLSANLRKVLVAIALTAPAPSPGWPRRASGSLRSFKPPCSMPSTRSNAVTSPTCFSFQRLRRLRSRQPPRLQQERSSRVLFPALWHR